MSGTRDFRPRYGPVWSIPASTGNLRQGSSRAPRPSPTKGWPRRSARGGFCRPVDRPTPYRGGVEHGPATGAVRCSRRKPPGSRGAAWVTPPVPAARSRASPIGSAFFGPGDRASASRPSDETELGSSPETQNAAANFFSSRSLRHSAQRKEGVPTLRETPNPRADRRAETSAPRREKVVPPAHAVARR